MPVIRSLLDTDLYKLTMQAVVVNKFGDAQAEYLLTNRTAEKHLTKEAAEWIRSEIDAMGDLRFSAEEIKFLSEKVPYLPAQYLDYLKTFRLFPHTQVTVEFEEDVVIRVKGAWRDTILYEIPVLAIVSEAYFKFVDTEWNYEGQVEQACAKTWSLAEAGCRFSEFGTRRRRSLKAQELVLEGILAAGTTNLIGTSNVMFAMKHGLQPVGTVAHELMMGVAAYLGEYQVANHAAMDAWLETVGHENAGYALTDTFGTPNFLETFEKPYTDYYAGVRQDSGDPLEYTNLISRHYARLGYPPRTKHILYSDSLNLELCQKYKSAAETAGLLPSFGVGTFFTNDFRALDGQASKPLNIVMKLRTLNGRNCVKLSDNVGKNMGDSAEVSLAKSQVGYLDSDNFMDENERW